MTQIMSKFAKHRNVYYFEAPVNGVSKSPNHFMRETREAVKVIEIFSRADMVLASSPSIYALKKDLHANLHHFPDCVC